MRMNGRFINRENELARMEAMRKSGRKEMLVLYGRRRLGKTALLRQFSGKHPACFFSCPISSGREALRLFEAQMARSFSEPLLEKTAFPGWNEAIEYAFQKARETGTLLIFDEIPYLLRSVPGVDSIIQHHWDNHKGAIWLALTGSLLSVMQKDILGDTAPLYGRRTAQLELCPMTFPDIGQFYSKRSMRDKFHYYAFFGGVPAYAEKAAIYPSPGKALLELVLSPDSVLYAEPEILVREELREPGNYFSIMGSLASGKTRPNEIALDAGVPHSGVNKYLETLCRMQLVKKVVPLTEKNPERSTKGLYLLGDPYLRFWFRYVYPYRSIIEYGRGKELYREVIRPDLDTYMGPVFEEICRQEIVRMGEKYLQWKPLRIGRYWDSGIEIDIMAVDARNSRAAFFECKWSQRVNVDKTLSSLRKKARGIPQVASSQHQYFVMSRTPSTHQYHIQLG